MMKGVVPRSGIIGYTDVREVFSHTKSWIFGYKLHIIVSTGSLIISLSSADFTLANVQDNQIYPATITSSLLQGVRYMAAADSGYDDHKLYDLSIHRRRGFELVCPVSEIYNSNTSSDILQLIEFYESELGQVIYS
jgi:hypothetical protein